MILDTTRADDRGAGFARGEHDEVSREAVRFPLLPALLLGLGLGGLLDGVVLHQLLQWHHMLSSWYPIDSIANLRVKTPWDGRLPQLHLCDDSRGRLSPLAGGPRIIGFPGRACSSPGCRCPVGPYSTSWKA